MDDETCQQLYAAYDGTFEQVRQAAQLSDGRFLLEIARGLARRERPVREVTLRAYCDAVRGSPKRSLRHFLGVLQLGTEGK